MELIPEEIRRALDRYGSTLPLAEMCWQIYFDYQRSLSYRGGVDFQDLIRLALKAVQEDKAYLLRLQHQFPYILEDEAQDSSQLQEKILRLLVGKKGNWVRVGDPNQAIYETFTTAKPEYLRDFLKEKGVVARELPNSGRSTRSVIELANYLIDWTLTKHPVDDIKRRKPLQPPKIEPTPAGDPQPNPDDDPTKIFLYPEALTPAEEIETVCNSVRRWLKDNADKTAAILVPRNDRGAQVVAALKKIGIEAVELLRSTSSTRETAGALVHLLTALSNPNASASLGMAYKVWRRDDRDDERAAERLEQIVKAIRSCDQVEDYLYPRADYDWLDSEAVTALTQEDDSIYEELTAFRRLMRRWQEAVVLPVDQLILTLAQDLFVTAPDLAIAHNLAVYLRRAGETSPHWRLPDFATELKAVAQNKRRVIDLGEEASFYDPDEHKGKVAVATMHSAKGLEWDRVYLMSVNAYDFPSAEPQDQFISERWYIRDHLNLQAEALAQLKALMSKPPQPYEAGIASDEARTEYAAERLRLLYVGITRARRELVITWNTGRDGKIGPATPLIGLQTYWENRKS
jgi:DNA helicase-2/ATP-dependent DNA helicase PcrA